MSHNLRLRVTVQRHGVPEVKLVWPCVRSPDLTVAKLLAQLDEVVPLEGGEWGLEDYAVELADGFECLHFQQILRILKDEDHVVVRCLMGEELMRRRLNGRHQITADGKHLVDGLVFGRPWLRAPQDRPALDLPPRKRARGEGDYDDYHDVDDDEWQEPRLLLEGAEMPVDDDASFVDFGRDENDNERTDDEMMEEVGDDEQALAEELRLLREDNAALGQDPSAENMAPASTGSGPGQGAVPKPPLDLDLLDAIVALRAAFPLTPATAIEAELVRQHKDLNKAYRALKTANDPALSFDDMMDHSVMGLLDTSETPPVEHAEGGASRRQMPLIQVVESDDGDGESSRGGSPNPGPQPQQAQSRMLAGYESDDEPSDSDDTSSSGTSSWHDGDGSSEDSTSDDSSGDDSSSDKSSSDDSSDSDNGVPVGNRAKANGRGEDSQGTTGELQKDSAPGLGLTLTQKRNSRRRRTKARMKCEQEQGTSGEAQTLEERKDQLLRLLSADADAAKDSLDAQEDGAETQQDKGGAEEAGPRRVGIDVGAGRRLLFGALGLRAPKTKADEEKIKQGLMKGVRPLMNPRLTDGKRGGDDEADSKEELEGGDEWRQKIRYRAVECCDEGVVLSEPPFPFEQRWDPQQQGMAGDKRKRKRKCLPAQDYHEGMYDDTSGLYVEEEDGGREKRARGRRAVTNGTGQEEDAAETGPGRDGAGRRKLLPAAAGRFAGAEDLPVPPADVSRLAELEAGVAKEGMVVTWKQMVMSKATQWQPQIVQRTGLVLGGDDDEVRVLLAVRDRGEGEREYDVKTGRRIYSKFEVPASESDEEGGEADGEMAMPWAEMMEARVVEGP